jgi:thiol-disulfide isomerase/thioredoxin
MKTPRRTALARTVPWPILLLAATVVAAPAETVVRGTLIGYDDRPMIRSHVHLVRPFSGDSLRLVETAPDGSYSLPVQEEGMLLVRFAGVHHRPVEVPIRFDEQTPELRIDVRLATYDYPDTFAAVYTAGDFNHFNLVYPVRMQPDFGGTYSAAFKWRGERVAYQIVGIVPGRSVNGTDAVDYAYDGSGDYRSIIEGSEEGITVVFDPRRLVRSDRPRELRFPESHAYLADMVALWEEMDARKDRYLVAMAADQRRGTEPRAAVADLAAELAASLPEQLARARRAPDGPLRAPLHLNALQVMRLAGGPPDSAFVAEAIETLDPLAPEWSLAPELLGYAIASTGGYVAHADDIEGVVRRHPDPIVRKSLLLRAMSVAADEGRHADAQSYHELIQEMFPGSIEAEFAAERVVAGEIVDGAKVPNFAVPSLEDPNLLLSNRTLEGKVYLMDFWATWCKPCVQEMPFLHEVYESFKDRGFEVVSLSLDRSAARIAPFRQKWPMPWKHAYLDGGFRSEIAQKFEVNSIPKPILVDRTGTIIGVGRELRGQQLRGAIESALQAQK